MPTDVYFNEGAQDMSVDANYTPALKPVNGDSLFQVAGSQAINAGLTALSAINLVLWFISRGFKGTSGTAGSPVTVGNVTGSMQIDGGGGQHYLAGGTVAECRVVGSGGGKVWLAAGTYTKLIVFGGDLEVGPACTVTNLKIIGGNVKMAALSSGGATTSVIMEGGTLTSERSCATVEVLGGAARAVFTGAAAITTKLRIAAGLVSYLSSGAITYLEGIAGTLTTQGAKNRFHVTNGELWKDFKIDDSNQLTYLVWDNAPTLYGFKGGNAL